MAHMKMKKTLAKLLLVMFLIVVLSVDGRKTSRGRSSGSGRGSSRRGSSNAQPAPTSFISPQASAPKPSLFGWQEKPVHKTQTSQSRQSKPSNTHSYPSSNSGLSGNNQPKQPSVHQDSVQRNSAPLNVPPHQNVRPGTQSGQANNQLSHSYPSSNGLSGNSGTQGAAYPQGSGLSGTGAAHPPNQAVNSLNTHQAQGGTNYNNMGTNYNRAQGQPPPYSSIGNNYHHSQGQPPPYSSVGNSYHHPPPPPGYSNFGPSYGGYGGHGSYNSGFGPQMPGYFGNYGGSKGFGGVSRTSSALTGVGIAGAGVGTILTGLALWNLARSTGRQHHTVIYDNRGQPVAVAPDDNSTATAMESVLGDLINCTLTINNENVTEILAIPCAIATSFTPEADVKDVNENKNENDNTKCIITIVTKAGREFMTTIPCSVLLNTAAQNNVTEPPLITNSTELNNATLISNDNILQTDPPTALKLSSSENNQDQNINSQINNCTNSLKPGEIPDPINPCYPAYNNLTVIPLQSTEAATP